MYELGVPLSCFALGVFLIRVFSTGRKNPVVDICLFGAAVYLSMFGSWIEAPPLIYWLSLSAGLLTLSVAMVRACRVGAG